MKRALAVGAVLLLCPLPVARVEAQASDDPPAQAAPASAERAASKRAKKPARRAPVAPSASPRPEAVKPAVAKPEAASAEAKPEKGKRGKSAEARVATRPRKRPVRRRKTAYDRFMEGMHAPAPDDAGALARSAPVRDLVFRLQGNDEPFVIKPLTDQGGFDTAALEVAKHAFGSWEAGPTPHARLLDLIYAAVLHFDVPYVYLISGVRKDRGGSRHSHGLAADVVFPGVTDEDLAAWFRAQGFCGVGTYPRSGFVHVDTRDKSYFWVDRSAPGRRGRVVGVRAEEARQVDAAAVERGSQGFVNPPRLQKALNVKAARRRRARAAQQARSAATAEPVKVGAAGPEK